jgi:hypothetical protein
MKSNESFVVNEVRALKIASDRLRGAADVAANVAANIGLTRPEYVAKLEKRAQIMRQASELLASARTLMEECP